MKMPDFVQITRTGRLTEEQFYPAVNAMHEAVWERLNPPQILTDGLANLVRNNVITPPDAPIPECLSCGACCVAHVCVGVRPGEDQAAADQWEIVPENDPDLVVDVYIRRDADTQACVALEGTIGENVACRVYETRPSVCRLFEAGSDRCHALRRGFGIEPFMTLDEMYVAVQKLKALRDDVPASNRIRNAKITRDETGKVTISILTEDGKLMPLHSYVPGAVTWRQFEFEGVTIDKAQELIRARTAASHRQ
jgi:Fe-S-cluster containining protein